MSTMFCSKCGKKIASKDEACKGCGAPAEAAEYCGGFFGLIEQEAKSKPVVQETVPAVDAELQYKIQKEEEEEQMRKKALIVMCAVCALLLVIIFVQALQGRAYNKSIEELKVTVSELSSQAEDVEKDDIIEKINAYIDHNNDTDENGKCDFCEGCLHKNTEEGFVALEDNKHVQICTECGDDLGDPVDCYDDEKDQDGVCDSGCGNTPVCDHEGERKVEKPGTEDNDYQHTTFCEKCYDDIKTEACVDTVDDGKSQCDVCETVLKCDHAGVDRTFVENSGEKDGTHKERCSRCSDELKAGFSDENGNNKCDECGFEWVKSDPVQPLVDDPFATGADDLQGGGTDPVKPGSEEGGTAGAGTGVGTPT